MGINADSCAGGSTQTRDQSVRPLYQSVNSCDYDENLLDFCCELHFLKAAPQTQRQSKASVKAINHSVFVYWVMSEEARPYWNMYNNSSIHWR